MQESVGLTYGLTMGPLGECKILVEPQNVETARELITLYETGEIDQIDFNTDDIDELGFDDAD